MNVACSRCGHVWDEGDMLVRFAYGEWRCTDEAACDDRIMEALDAR